jgi:hypothetical protein
VVKKSTGNLRMLIIKNEVQEAHRGHFVGGGGGGLLIKETVQPHTGNVKSNNEMSENLLS